MSNRPAVLLLEAIRRLSENDKNGVAVSTLMEKVKAMRDDDKLVLYDFELSPVSGKMISPPLRDALLTLINPLRTVEVKGDMPHISLTEQGQRVLEAVTISDYEAAVLQEYCRR